MKIFIGGSKMISDIDKNVKEKLNEIIKNKYEVLIGDCWGIDAAVQKFFVEKDYRIHWNFTAHTYIRENDIKNSSVFVSRTGKPLDRSHIWKMFSVSVFVGIDVSII